MDPRRQEARYSTCCAVLYVPSVLDLMNRHNNNNNYNNNTSIIIINQFREPPSIRSATITDAPCWPVLVKHLSLPDPFNPSPSASSAYGASRASEDPAILRDAQRHVYVRTYIHTVQFCTVCMYILTLPDRL